MAKEDKGTTEIKDMIRSKRDRAAVGPIPDADLLSTGCTLLNLQLSGRTRGGLCKGKYFWFVGDSSSGKSLFMMTVLAEAARNPEFDKYDFYYDNNEDGMLFDIAKFFGQGVQDRLRNPPHGESRTTQKFYYNLDTVLERAKEKKRPCIYILDSQDGLDSDEAKKKFKKQMKAEEDGKEEAGSYGDGKAKLHSQNMRRIIPELKETGSILIVVSQTRDNIGFGFDPKTVGGGRALKFYATAEIWTSITKTLKKHVKGRDRDIGIRVQAKVKKNRLSGRSGRVEMPVYWSYGIDDVGSMLHFLIEEGHWKKKNGDIRAPELDFTGSEADLIALVEEKGLEKTMRRTVKEVWKEIEAACRVERKPKYA